MKKAQRSFPLVLALFALLFILACINIRFPGDLGTPAPISGIPEVSLTGSIKGTAAAMYDVWVNNVEVFPKCADNEAEYNLAISPDSKLPSDTHITGSISSGQRYFRLDIYAALYQLKDGQCDYVNPSDVRTHIVVEGSLNPKDFIMTPLACGSKTLGESNMGIFTLSANQTTTNYKVNGDINCSDGPQIKYNFHFETMDVH
jgi:hypothetical protein